MPFGKKTIAQLLDTAHSRIETEEYPLALQKIYEILQLDPANTEALSLQSSVENKRTEHDMEEWFRLAAQHLERFDFSHAREALQRVLQLRPQEGRAMQMLFEVEHLEQEHDARAPRKGATLPGGAGSRSARRHQRSIEQAGAGAGSGSPGARCGRARARHELSESVQQSSLRAREHAARLCGGETSTGRRRLPGCSRDLRGSAGEVPGNALFQALKIDVEERHRQALSARIAETDRKVAAEPDLDRRIAIVEDAVG